MIPPVPIHDTTPDHTLDPWHTAVLVRIMAADRARVDAGATRVVRLAEPHEFCLPGAPCVTWPTLVVVTAIADGLRARQPIGALEAVA